MASNFDRFSDKFILDPPTDANAFRIYRGAWHYNFDRLSLDEILTNIHGDPRPRWCAETYPGFRHFHVVELGPGDGYNTAALEYLGARQVTSIEGNVDAFIRCLILKNALGLNSKFLLGDFTRCFEGLSSRADMLYACGVLYHLIDPIGFLQMAASHVEHLFLWTHVYDERYVDLVEHERVGFANRETYPAVFGGRTFTYHRKYYDVTHVSLSGYIGGLHRYAHWISREDLFAGLDICGFKKIHKIVEDPYEPGRMPAINVLTSRV